MTLTNHEENLRQECYTCGGHSVVTVYETVNTVLFWPGGWSPQWYQESGVNQVSGVASWLERAYEQMCEWMAFEPNEYYLRKNGVRHRLAFVCNGESVFQAGRGPRPYIGLGKGEKPCWHGSEDWFGWLCHELSHDFLHEPRLGPDAACWGNGLCDYFRCKLLHALGMKKAATNFERYTETHAVPHNEYSSPAKLLLEYEGRHGFASPLELVRSVRDKYLCQEVGPVTWG